MKHDLIWNPDHNMMENVRVKKFFIHLDTYGASCGSILTYTSNGVKFVQPQKPKTWLELAMEEAAGNEQLSVVLSEIIEKFKDFEMLRKLGNDK